MELLAVVILILGMLFATLQYQAVMFKFWKGVGCIVSFGMAVILAIWGWISMKDYIMEIASAYDYWRISGRITGALIMLGGLYGVIFLVHYVAGLFGIKLSKPVK